MLYKILKIFLSFIPVISFFSLVGNSNEIKNKFIPTKFMNSERVYETQWPLIIAESVTRFVSIHVKGLENELLELKDSIKKSANVPKELNELLTKEKSNYFDGYFLTYMLLGSDYALTSRYEFTAELFTFWMNTPDSKKNHFWKLIDYFYTNIVPNIMKLTDKNKIWSIVDKTSSIKQLTINVAPNGELLNNNSFIDLFKSKAILRHEMSWVISQSVNVWSLDDSMKQIEDKFDKDLFPTFVDDNNWVSNTLLDNIQQKIDVVLTTRVDIKENKFWKNNKYENFEKLNDDLKKITTYKYGKNKERVGIDLENGITSAINYYNNLWNEEKHDHFIDLDKTYNSTKLRLLKLFNYLFNLYIIAHSDKNLNDINYLYLIKNINISFTKIPGANGQSFSLEIQKDMYGEGIATYFDAWRGFSKNDPLTYESTGFESTLSHEFGHAVDFLVEQFDWKNGNERLKKYHQNTLKTSFEHKYLSPNRFEEHITNPVENLRLDEIVEYKDLETPILYMNENRIDNLYYEIRGQIESYIKWYENDIWGKNKDLNNILKNIDIKSSDGKLLDKLVSEIMISYNKGESKVFDLKINSLYEFKNKIDLDFKVVNTKKTFKHLNDIELSELSISINENENQSIELISNIINNKLTSLGIKDVDWKVVYDGKYFDLNNIDFTENGIDKLNIIVTGKKNSEYQGFSFFTINTIIKKDIFDVVTDTNLGTVYSVDKEYLLNKIMEKYPKLWGEISIDNQYPIKDGEIAIVANKLSDYIGTVVFTYNYVEDGSIGGGEINSADKSNAIIEKAIIGAIVIIVGITIIVIIRTIIKNKKNKSR